MYISKPHRPELRSLLGCASRAGRGQSAGPLGPTEQSVWLAHRCGELGGLDPALHGSTAGAACCRRTSRCGAKDPLAAGEELVDPCSAGTKSGRHGETRGAQPFGPHPDGATYPPGVPHATGVNKRPAGAGVGWRTHKPTGNERPRSSNRCRPSMRSCRYWWVGSYWC